MRRAATPTSTRGSSWPAARAAAQAPRACARRGAASAAHGASRDCDFCHETDDFKKTIFDHDDRRFTTFALDGKHAKVACAGCHPTVHRRRGRHDRPLPARAARPARAATSTSTTASSGGSSRDAARRAACATFVAVGGSLLCAALSFAAARRRPTDAVAPAPQAEGAAPERARRQAAAARRRATSPAAPPATWSTAGRRSGSTTTRPGFRCAAAHATVACGGCHPRGFDVAGRRHLLRLPPRSARRRVRHAVRRLPRRRELAAAVPGRRPPAHGLPAGRQARPDPLPAVPRQHARPHLRARAGRLRLLPPGRLRPHARSRRSITRRRASAVECQSCHNTWRFWPARLAAARRLLPDRRRARTTASAASAATPRYRRRRSPARARPAPSPAPAATRTTARGAMRSTPTRPTPR